MGAAFERMFLGVGFLNFALIRRRIMKQFCVRIYFVVFITGNREDGVVYSVIIDMLRTTNYSYAIYFSRGSFSSKFDGVAGVFQSCFFTTFS